MPRGNPKQAILVRIDPDTIAAVRRYTDNFTGAVEAGLAWWLKRAKRQADKSEAKPQPEREEAA